MSFDEKWVVVSFDITQENRNKMLVMERSNPNWEERNVLKHVVILKEHLTPQYGYYGFALLRGISQDYVFETWVREIYFWECDCNNFSHSEYFSLVVLWQRPWFFSGFRVFHVNLVLYDWCILHLIFLLICCLINCLEWSWEEAQFPNSGIRANGLYLGYTVLFM